MPADYTGQVVMKEIELKDAKANLSAVIDEAVAGKPATITRHGKPEAVIVGYEEWLRLSDVSSFGRLLMTAPLEDGDIERDQTPVRDPGL